MLPLLSGLALTGALLATPALARNQEPDPATPITTEGTATAPAEPQLEAEAVAPEERVLSGFFVDVGRDYKAWFTLDSTRTLMIGTATTMFLRPADEALTNRGFPVVGEGLSGGQQYGNITLQVPLAVGWWAIGHMSGSPRAADTGRDLLRAQINAASFTYALKYAVRRTRPNGDVRSFPSGHASATFATATVLQQHYGWKLGLPFYLLGVYTAGSRIQDKKHWLTDTVMGATVGVTAGRAVTFRLKERPVQVMPGILPGGAQVLFLVEP